MAEPGGLRRAVPLMGTVFSVDVRAPVEQPRVAAAVDDIVAWWRWVDATFSTYRADSVIRRLDRGELRLEQCPPQVAEVLDRCARVERLSDRWFTARPTGRLDPSGLVKGWSVEVASETLRAAGLVDHCLSGGGDVRAAGGRAPGVPWRVGVSDPLRPGRVLAVVDATDSAVATSGTGERGAHIVNPHTGRPATDLAAVTVVGPDLGDADAYATAAVAMGRAARCWLADLARREGYEALVVAADGAVWCTERWHSAMKEARRIEVIHPRQDVPPSGRA